VCPIEEANVVREVDGKIIVEINSDKCIACGVCQPACHHGSRYYEDDTDRFFADLARGERINIFTAPAMKANLRGWGSVLAWLRGLGADKIYDVSLGADICTWAHIRHIQKSTPGPIISQPCPAIVNYILMHRSELVKHLSPVHSPMLCTAIFMRKYEGVTGKIAALSPCAAKACEFDATGMVDYNVTIKNFYDYIVKNDIVINEGSTSDFDHYRAGLGNIYPMPGGLKENIQHYIGKTLRIDMAEGPNVVYNALDEYVKQSESALPAVFDVLNCTDGCNLGTGCRHDLNVFEVNALMNDTRQATSSGDEGKQYLSGLFTKFDEQLRLDDFLRVYTPAQIQEISITPDDIEAAFMAIDKPDEESRHHDCGACGNDRCTQMAEQVAKGINIPQNCTWYVKTELKRAAREAEKARHTAETAMEEMRSSILYARKIQQHRLPKNADLQKIFTDGSMMWHPSEIVSGDMTWIKQFDRGTTLSVFDCTGHGTPGALLTMLVSSALDAVVTPENCDDTADILWQLDQKLTEAFKVEAGAGETGGSDFISGCDPAVLFITPKGDITISSGRMGVFVCNGKEVTRIRGQKIFIGDGSIDGKESINTISIPADPDNKFYIATDGLFDQPGGENSAPFGYRRLEKIMLENHNKTLTCVSQKIWQEYQAHKGEEHQVDDVQLIAFKP